MSCSSYKSEPTWKNENRPNVFFMSEGVFTDTQQATCDKSYIVEGYRVIIK